jgi:hypothetical protein
MPIHEHNLGLLKFYILHFKKDLIIVLDITIRAFII